MKEQRVGAGPSAGWVESTANVRRQLEDLGLNGYEARVLVALVQLGSGGATELARLSGVDRTNIYAVMTTLVDRGLATQLPSKVTRWTSFGSDEVLSRLYARNEERLAELRAGMDQARSSLASIASSPPAVAPPHLQFIRGAAQAEACFQDLLARSEHEILMFTRPPYMGIPTQVDPAVVATLARGVSIRVLYEAERLEPTEGQAFRAAADAFAAAGVQARVADHLPIKLAVSDLKVALVAMPEIAEADDFPTNVLIEHPGYAAVHARAFEHLWAESTPYHPEQPSSPKGSRASLPRQMATPTKGHSDEKDEG